MSRYDDEEFLPWYRRPTVGWLELSAAARGVLVSIAMELNPKNGQLVLRRGLPSLAVLLRMPWEDIEPALAELVAAEKLSWDGSRFTLSDPEHSARKRSSSAERMARKRARDNAVESARVPVTCDGSDASDVTSTLLSSDLISSEKGESEREGAVRRDLPLAEDARAVWDSLTMNRDAGLPLADVWIGFCGQYAGQDFRNREALLGRWQKWIGVQFKIADTDRERKRRAEDSRAKRYADHVPKTEPQTAAEAKAFQAELMRRLAQKTGTG